MTAPILKMPPIIVSPTQNQCISNWQPPVVYAPYIPAINRKCNSCGAKERNLDGRCKYCDSL